MISSLNVSEAYHEVLRILSEAQRFGYKVLPDGARLFGHVPHVAPLAWLHALFAPLSSEDLKNLESELNHKIPEIYSEWLRISNGLHLFSGSLSLDGRRTDYSRRLDIWQPFSLDVPNVHERPRDAEPYQFFIGGYEYDGSLLFIDERDGRVYRCRPYSAVDMLDSWADFPTLLVSEARRLSLLFDSEGRRIDPDVPTTPLYQAD